MFPTDYIVYLQLLLFLFISPGLPRVLIVSHTLNYGLKRSVWTAFGDISANFLQGFAMVFLIGTFLKDNPEFLNLLKWAGILFTVYLAYDTYTAKIKSVEQGSRIERSKKTILFNVYLPAAGPTILAGMRISLGFTYTVLVAAEIVAASAGIGWMIWDAAKFLLSDVVIMGLIVLGLTGIGLDIFMRFIGRILMPWTRYLGP